MIIVKKIFLTLSIFLTIFLFVLVKISLTLAQQLPTPEPNTWYMAGANPQRTSWINTDISGITGVDWYRPIEAYINPKTQIITSNKKIYVATSRGLIVLDAETGEFKWQFATELPLAHSPIVVEDMVYFGGMDRKLYALRDRGNSYEVAWVFSQAEAGYSESPLFVNNILYVGNRDGRMYAVNAQTGALIWQFPQANQPPLPLILIGAAYSPSQNAIYFAALNMRAYALNAATGAPLWFHEENGQQIAGSEKLPGERIQSWWPVIYKNSVIFSTQHPFGGAKAPNMDWRDAVFNSTTTSYSGDILTSNGSQGWANGASLLDSEHNTSGNYSIQNYLNTFPHRRTTIALDITTGTMLNNSANPPYLWSGTTNGSRVPPIVSLDGEIIYNTNSFSKTANNIPRARIMGWKTNNRYLFMPSATTYAIDEPAILSGAGSDIMINLCCDRIAAIITRNRVFWDYGVNPGMLDNVLPSQLARTGTTTTYAPNTPNRYDLMWQLIDSSFERLKGYYKGNYNTPNGNYSNHGLQNPLVPYRFTNSQGQIVQRLFTHRSNTIIALGTTGSKTFLPLITKPQTIDPAARVEPLSQVILHRKLKWAVDELVGIWERDPSHRFLNPGYYNNGQWFTNSAVTGVYFEDPAETVLVLSQAYRALTDEPLKQRLLTYLREFVNHNFTTNFYTSVGWQGLPREDVWYPPEIVSEMQNSPPNAANFRQRTFYALWKFVDILSNNEKQTAANQLYNATINRLVITTNPYAASGWTQERWLHQRTWEVNEYIAGYQGFLNLQAIALNNTYNSSQQTTRNNVQNALNNVLTLRSNQFYKDTINYGEFDNPTGISENLAFRKLNFARNFLFLTPELGQTLAANKRQAITQAIQEYTDLAPFWFAAAYDADFKESAMRHLYDSPSIFSAQAYILGKSQDELSKYIDAPTFPRGDLYYIQKLAIALSQTSCNRTTGDIDCSGIVTSADLIILLENYGTYLTSLDINNDTKINNIDSAIILTKILGVN